MIAAFTFEHGGRKYSCAAERRPGALEGTWWWFAVSYDQNRYAPFEASRDDSQTSVRERIIAFYERRLWARAQPPEPRNAFSHRPKPGIRVKPALPPAPPPQT
jgi:hypothetical protein